VALLSVDNSSNPADPLLESVSILVRDILNEESFKRRIAIERRRTERSKNPFLLMLLEDGHHQGLEKNGKNLGSIASALQSSTRDTDVIGWYKDRTVIGVVYTDLPDKDKNSLISIIHNRVRDTLRDVLMLDHLNHVSITFHYFPDNWDQNKSGSPPSSAVYPDLLSPDKGRRSVLIMKRVIDIVVSALMLIFCAPLLIMIALAIKVSSKGPVLFRQQRIGQYGHRFTFLKFRTMYANTDHSVHKKYITKFIANEAEHQVANENGEGVYKLTNDSRVTRVGKYLRRSSLDEIPQFLNVLKGDMSIIGPRPPIPYELAAYQTWHLRRVLEVKPGITGLWQVTGRSRVKFDEMVRLDLRYAASLSLGLDFKILMRTPLAMIKGIGAY